MAKIEVGDIEVFKTNLGILKEALGDSVKLYDARLEDWADNLISTAAKSALELDKTCKHCGRPIYRTQWLKENNTVEYDWFHDSGHKGCLISGNYKATPGMY